MNQKEYIFKLTEQGKKPDEIKQFLEKRFGEEAYHRSTIYKWHGQAKIGVSIENNNDRPGNKLDDQLLIRVQQVLEEEPFSSTRSIADKLKENNVTIYRYLTKYLHKVFKSSRWIPHFLTNAQKVDRVDKTKALSKLLKSCKHNSFRGIITGDQKWFTLYYGNDGAWLEMDEDPPEMNGDQISIKKVMVTIIWGVYGFYIVDFMPDGESYNSSYFITNILEPLAKKKAEIWHESSKRKLTLHLDNSKVHNSKWSTLEYTKKGFKRAPHPAYSPDVAPSDFFLFGFLEEKLKGKSFADVDEFEEALLEILGSISIEIKKKVFNHWIERCDWIIKHDGAYFHK